VRLLPVSAEGETPQAGAEGSVEYIYEPSEEELLANILPMYVRVLIFRGLLETSAGEHGARMAAMDNATKNCEEMKQALSSHVAKMIGALAKYCTAIALFIARYIR
jgi:F-type H+-transporting ATPase subunit gamma